jgi:hypothetical protein
MYEHNFISWDFYMVNFLISFKDIREIIDNTQRNKKIKHSRINSQVKIHKDIPKTCSDEDRFYSFILTNADGANSYYKIIPSQLQVFIPHYELEKQFYFNLRQMRIVDLLSQDKSHVESFFKKILFLNKKDQIILDYDRLDSMTPVLFKCIQRYEKEDRSKQNWVISLW